MTTLSSINNYKVLITGPVGAGKSTAVQALCGKDALSTETAATDMTIQRKATTTVAMDYGTVKLEQGGVLHVYGTPGQERFNFMWDILAEGGLGLILLLDNARTNVIHDLDLFMGAFKDDIDHSRIVIGITRMDVSPTPVIDVYQQHLSAKGFGMIPVFEVDARSRQDMRILMQALICRIDPRLALPI